MARLTKEFKEIPGYLRFYPTIIYLEIKVITGIC